MDPLIQELQRAYQLDPENTYQDYITTLEAVLGHEPFPFDEYEVEPASILSYVAKPGELTMEEARYLIRIAHMLSQRTLDWEIIRVNDRRPEARLNFLFRVEDIIHPGPEQLLPSPQGPQPPDIPLLLYRLCVVAYNWHYTFLEIVVPRELVSPWCE